MCFLDFILQCAVKVHTCSLVEPVLTSSCSLVHRFRGGKLVMQGLWCSPALKPQDCECSTGNGCYRLLQVYIILMGARLGCSALVASTRSFETARECERALGHGIFGIPWLACRVKTYSLSDDQRALLTHACSSPPTNTKGVFEAMSPAVLQAVQDRLHYESLDLPILSSQPLKTTSELISICFESPSIPHTL